MGKLWAMALVLCATLVSAVQADDGDDTLEYYLSKSDLVVVGKITNEPSAVFRAAGAANYRCEVGVAEVLKGKWPEKKLLHATVIRFESTRADESPLMKQGVTCILFLKADDLRTADVWYGVQPYTAWMAASLKRMAERKQ